MHINVEPDAGDGLGKSVHCALNLARATGIEVNFTFNGTPVYVRTSDTESDVTKRYYADTLTATERSVEAKRLLGLLRDEGDSVLQANLTSSAYQFVNQKLNELELLAEMGSKAELVLAVSTAQLFWLRDLWAKFN